MSRETTYQRQCTWCGKDFEAYREEASFHSQACKQAYWRWRHGVELEVAKAKASFEMLVNYARHEETSAEAWLALSSLKEEIDFCLERD
jgi:hypothetical protein